MASPSARHTVPARCALAPRITSSSSRSTRPRRARSAWASRRRCARATNYLAGRDIIQPYHATTLHIHSGAIITRFKAT